MSRRPAFPRKRALDLRSLGQLILVATVVLVRLVLWGALAGAQSGCGSSALPPCGAPEPPPVAAPTSDQLAIGQWRLFSPVFAALPAGGDAIVFSRDGTVQTSNLAGVTGWSMPRSGRLELTGGGRVIYGFTWSERYGAFRRVDSESLTASLSMVIAPVGLDTLRVAAAMERQPGETDPTSRQRAAAALPVRLEGAKVDNPGEAVTVAVDAYFARAGGKRSIRSAAAIGAESLGFDVPGFAKAGDRVWEVRVYEFGTLSGVIWVNAETGGTRFVAP
jgi:hypothetical protein